MTMSFSHSIRLWPFLSFFPRCKVASNLLASAYYSMGTLLLNASKCAACEAITSLPALHAGSRTIDPQVYLTQAESTFEIGPCVVFSGYSTHLPTPRCGTAKHQRCFPFLQLHPSSSSSTSFTFSPQSSAPANIENISGS